MLREKIKCMMEKNVHGKIKDYGIKIIGTKSEGGTYRVTGKNKGCS